MRSIWDDGPVLQVRAADRGVELDRGACVRESQAELDVLDRRLVEPDASKPPADVKTSLRTAPRPAQNVSAGPGARV